MFTTYLLITHGSRSPGPQIAVAQLATLVRQQLEEVQAYQFRSASNSSKSVLLLNKPPAVLLETAVLEFGQVPLHEKIVEFTIKSQQQGAEKVKIVPLFLLPGVHVREDIPAEVAKARQALPTSISIELMPYLGSYPGIISLLEEQFIALDTPARILLAHGSRRLGGNQPIEAIASQLGAVAAYWFVAPQLKEQIQHLQSAGYRKIAILPYFLFSGGITTIIAQEVQKLQQNQPQWQLILGEPLGVTHQLADLIFAGISL